MIVYIDVFFALNFLMDLLILLAVNKISSENKPLYRMIFSACIGAIYSCIILISNIQYGILEGFLTYVIMSILLTIIAFGYKGIVQTIEMIVILFVVTFITSGIVNSLYARNIISDTKDLLIVAGIGVGITCTVFKLSKRKFRLNTKILDVKIVNSGREVSVKALIDTGNSLKEPISRRPVAVLSKDIAGQIRRGDGEGTFIIPFKSVGKEHGILKGFMTDYIEITDKEAKNGRIIRRINKPIIAEYDGLFTDSNEYQMLLHPQMIEEGERYVCKSSDSK